MAHQLHECCPAPRRGKGRYESTRFALYFRGCGQADDGANYGNLVTSATIDQRVASGRKRSTVRLSLCRVINHFVDRHERRRVYCEDASKWGSRLSSRL
jgi:hypothetical protein